MGRSGAGVSTLALTAHVLRRRQPRPGDVWHLDEVVVKVAGRSIWLWRAVDQHVVFLEEILQSRRDKRAAKRLLVKLMMCWRFVPKRIITNKLRSYGAAKREVAPGLDHWSHKLRYHRYHNLTTSRVNVTTPSRVLMSHLKSKTRVQSSSSCKEWRESGESKYW
ncbi:DDE-type integrase/transposase/recombinase [uncultured Roseovarius sp.]|uniref:DDE-type integrase/transposase/recombinase n=1 Tax=uncultured Roseovarius sp. TaxID=293344 RepID=UPI00263A2460|nr:DDE-type integrase/transposase/recombinase [uncultured Roseovarius sp.]